MSSSHSREFGVFVEEPPSEETALKLLGLAAGADVRLFALAEEFFVLNFFLVRDGECVNFGRKSDGERFLKMSR